MAEGHTSAPPVEIPVINVINGITAVTTITAAADIRHIHIQFAYVRSAVIRSRSRCQVLFVR
jgi:hypothetical protein